MNEVCRICGGEIRLVLKLNPMPLVDDYNSGPEAELFDTELFACNVCNHVQLGKIVNPAKMFNKEYAYKTGYSPGLKKHFDGLAELLIDRANLKEGSLAIDVGCNDGTFLKALENKSRCAVWGIDPAKATDVRGLETSLTNGTAKVTVHFVGKANLVTANNVLAHVADPIGFLRAARGLLKPNGIFACEVGNFNSVICDYVWETIYHEHLNYFTHDVLSGILWMVGFEPVYTEFIETHGGSIRIVSKLGNEERIKNNHEETKRYEELNKISGNVENRRKKILELCDGRSDVVAFGASAKASVILNQTGFRPRMVVDDNPKKQNKKMPGLNVPIVGRDVLEKLEGGEKILVLAWNEIKAISESMPEFAGRFVVASPEPYLI